MVGFVGERVGGEKERGRGDQAHTVVAGGEGAIKRARNLISVRDSEGFVTSH